MSVEIYEAPALQEVGDFDELTKCLGTGSCRDFVGCGYAIVCFW
ncbi:aborycin family tricyclic lasso peptide [Streptomyces erythrochromogenes]